MPGRSVVIPLKGVMKAHYCHPALLLPLATPPAPRKESMKYSPKLRMRGSDFSYCYIFVFQEIHDPGYVGTKYVRGERAAARPCHPFIDTPTGIITCLGACTPAYVVVCRHTHYFIEVTTHSIGELINKQRESLRLVIRLRKLEAPGSCGSRRGHCIRMSLTLSMVRNGSASRRRTYIFAVLETRRLTSVVPRG